MNLEIQEEWLDVVNEHDEVVDRKSRTDFYAQNLSYFRAVNGFVKNSKGQLWIPRRTAHKKLFPLCLDSSVGGHVQSGETYEAAFARETQEEILYDVQNLSITYLGYLTPHQGLAAFMKVYEIALDEVSHYNTNDFSECMWIYPEELYHALQHGEKSKTDLPLLLQHLYIKRP